MIGRLFMQEIKHYVGIFPTPGGDKHHLFAMTDGNNGLTGSITNSLGPTELENCQKTEGGFSADMPAGPGKHHFEAEYTGGGIHVNGSVIMEGNQVATYEADMELTSSSELPPDGEGPQEARALS